MNGKIVAYGELLLRLSAADGTIRDSRSFNACYGGTESNVLACLSALGHKTSFLSALPEGPLGEAALDHLTGLGIDVSGVLTGGDTIGMYFSESGSASRGANVVYARRHSQFTLLTEDSFDFEKVFDGAVLFHISGISLALSPSSRDLAFRLMHEAKKRNITVSFDFNYRPALWTADNARAHLRRAAGIADILLASSRDLDAFLQTGEENALDDYPCKYLVLRDRNVVSPSLHSVGIAMLHRGERRSELPVFSFPVTEKIGGGDAFNGAFLHALLCGMNDIDILRFAAAAFALKHQVKGDVLKASENDIISFMNKTEDIQ